MHPYRHFDFHPPDEVRLFTVPVSGIRRWDPEAVVYDVRVGEGAVLRHYAFPNRWFAVNCSLDLAGGFVTESGPIDWCFNCDITTPAQVLGSDFYNVDLCLDLLAGPDGKAHVVVDEDDFAEAVSSGWFSPAEQAGARQGLADLLAIIRATGLVEFLQKIYPFGDLSACEAPPPWVKLPLSEVPLLAPTQRWNHRGREGK